MTGSTLGAPSALQMLLGFYAYLLPMLLYVLWSTLALWDIGHRTDMGRALVWTWVIAVFLLPFVGPLAYLVFAGRKLPQSARWVTVGGGIGCYIVVLLIAAAIGAS